MTNQIARKVAALEEQFPLPEDMEEDLLSNDFWNATNVLRQIHEVASTHGLSGEAILNFCMFNLAISVHSTCRVIVPWDRGTELFWDPVVHGRSTVSRKSTALHRADELVAPMELQSSFSRKITVDEVLLDEDMISQESISWVYARPQPYEAEEDRHPVDVTPIGNGVAAWAAENTKPMYPLYWIGFQKIDSSLPRDGGNRRAEFSWRIRASTLLGLLHKETQPNRLYWDLSQMMYDSSEAAKKYINHPNWWARRNAILH